MLESKSVLEHVPARYAKVAPGTHDELVSRMIERMGRDAALEFDMLAQTYALMRVSGAPDADEPGHFATLARAIDSDFAAQFAKSVERKVHEETAARQSTFDRVNARMQRGEPLVTGAELNAFVESGGADAVLAALDPSLLYALENSSARSTRTRSPTTTSERSWPRSSSARRANGTRRGKRSSRRCPPLRRRRRWRVRT